MNLNTEKFTEVSKVVKDGVLTLLILISVAFFWVGVYRSTVNQAIQFQPILVPVQFIEKGYTPEITTIRLMDEIKKFNDRASTLKSRNLQGAKQAGEDLSSITSAAVGTIDVKAVQSFFREVMGIQAKTISGEITVIGNPNNETYLVRIRQNPGGVLLVDKVFEGSQEKVLEMAALQLIERFEPVVALSYYRDKGQFLDAFRVSDVAQAGKNSYESFYGLLQEIQVYLDLKNYKKAKIGIDKALLIDKNDGPLYGLVARWYTEQSMFKEGIEASETEIKLRPEIPHGYINKGVAMQGLGLDPESVFLEGLSKDRPRALHFIRAGNYFESKGKLEIARNTYLRGAIDFPDNPKTNYWHGRRLFLDGKNQLGIFYLKKANILNPSDKKTQELLSEAMAAQNDFVIEAGPVKNK